MTNLTTFMSRLSRNLAASILWNPQGRPGFLMGFLCFALVLSLVLYDAEDK